MMLEGAVDTFGGIFLLAWPGISSLAPTLYVAAWALLVGLMEMLGALLMYGLIAHVWLLLMSGVASLVFGIVLAAYRWVELSASVALIGEYAVIWGALALVMATGLLTRISVAYGVGW
jgi:uncharacterized membrane protein HdeD (DUF308 family)